MADTRIITPIEGMESVSSSQGTIVLPWYAIALLTCGVTIISVLATVAACSLRTRTKCNTTA